MSRNSKGVKRIGNLYETIYSIDNLELADIKASKGKSGQNGVQAHMRNRDNNLLALQRMLQDKTYRTSAYKTFVIYEPKRRDIFSLPYFPDRIGQHADMNILERIFMRHFTADTYSCIKGRGIHGAARAIRKVLRDEAGTQYCLKLDIKKFYPSVDHAILKRLLRRLLKDNDLLSHLDEIIDSAEGLPIGNYLSQYFANYYLSGFDHWLKEVKRVRYYFRYCDDLVILSGSKEELHRLKADITEYLAANLMLTVKANYQVFPVAARGIDFVGYVFFHTHTLLRKGIKKNFARKMARGAGEQVKASYRGWTKHCNGINLYKTLTNEEFQRNGHRAHNRKLCRRKDKNRQSTEHRDNRTSVSAYQIKIP